MFKKASLVIENEALLACKSDFQIDDSFKAFNIFSDQRQFHQETFVYFSKFLDKINISIHFQAEVAT